MKSPANTDRCVMAHYLPAPGGHYEVQQSSRDAAGGWVNATGFLSGSFPNIDARLKIWLGNGPTADYWVMDTDYNTYSAVYSCESIRGEYHAETVWLLGRRPALDAATVTKLTGLLSQRGVDTAQLT